MKITSVYVIIILLACTGTVGAQDTDSLERFLVRAAEQTKKPYFLPLTSGLDRARFLVSADSLGAMNNNIPARAFINEELGYYYYRTDADKSIKYNLAANKLYNEAENKKRAAQCLHNIAFAYDEQKSDIPGAIKYTRLAIKAREELKDTLATANMIKYLGLLQGKAHDFAEAKKNEAEAIRLFMLKNFKPGAAVCYRDLATVNEQEHNLDSCVANIIHAKNIWQEENKDTTRIFDANNILLRTYTAQNKLKEAGTIFHENESMITGNAMQDMNRTYMELLDYYKICQAYFNKTNDQKTEKAYLAKYAAYKQELEQKGFHLDGY